MPKKETTIKLSFKTKSRLLKLKKGDDTFESVIIENLNPLDAHLKELWDNQDERRKKKRKKELEKRLRKK